MASKIVIKMKKIYLLLFLLISNIIVSQNTDYYALEKDSEKHLKIIRNILFDGGGKTINNSGDIIFNIEKQRFRCVKSVHKIDTCLYGTSNSIKTISISQLIKDEHAEHVEKTKDYDPKFPFPFKHYNTKVFVFEKVSLKKIIKYEVDWIYSIN